MAQRCSNGVQAFGSKENFVAIPVPGKGFVHPRGHPNLILFIIHEDEEGNVYGVVLPGGVAQLPPDTGGTMLSALGPSRG